MTAERRIIFYLMLNDNFIINYATNFNILSVSVDKHYKLCCLLNCYPAVKHIICHYSRWEDHHWNNNVLIDSTDTNIISLKPRVFSYSTSILGKSIKGIGNKPFKCALFLNITKHLRKLYKTDRWCILDKSRKNSRP